MKTPAHLSCSVAALALLLAACGGGGGSNDNNNNNTKAVSSTPSASSTGSGSAITTRDSASSGVSANNARGTSGTHTATDTSPVSRPVSSISAQGVRGDVLLTMLDQKSCDPIGMLSASYDGPQLDNGDDFPPPWISHRISGDNYRTNPQYQNNVDYSPIPGALCPPLLIYSPVPSGVYTYSLSSGIYGRFTSPGSRPRGFSPLSTRIPVAVTQDAIIIGASIEATATPSWGKTFRDQNPNGEPSEELSFGKSESSKTIGMNSRVPFGVLSTWTDTSNDEKPYTMTTRMLLLPGAHSNQAKLCFNTDMKYVKRLHCTIWTVPENWKRSMELKDDGQYIVDDRSTYPGESGLLYWRTGSDS